jgi:hypothetical protein
MSSEAFDFVALIRALLIGLGCGLVVAAVAGFVRRTGPKGFLVMLGAGVVVLLTVILFFSWPSLIRVPDLGGLSRDEAKLVLEKKALVPEARPLYHSDTEPGRVIAHSQEPAAGIKVRGGTVVRFGVAIGTTRTEEPTEELQVGASLSVSLFRPKSGEKAHCTRYADGVYRFSVVGTSTGLTNGFRLLLWVRPVNPPSETPGWYLQRLPVNGIEKVEPDGSWEGIAQIGNVQWPPHAGDVLDVAVTVVDVDRAKRLGGELGVVTRTVLPGIASDVASGVRVELK